MKSLKNKVVLSFITIIIIIVVMLQILFMVLLRNHYRNNTEAILLNQLKISSELYSKYYSYRSLEENVSSNVDAFWNTTNAQVEIFDVNGNLLMDSIAVIDKQEVKEPLDVKEALKGNSSSWIGREKYYKDEVLAVSYPLKDGEKVVGVLRYITSLSEVNSTIKSITILFVAIGTIVIIVGAIISYFLAGTIVDPIKSLTNVAEKYAEGKLDVRSELTVHDELGKLSDTFNFMADEIVKREKLKNEFISSVSHELRTPLTAIKGWIITLNSSETDKQTLSMGFDIIEKETDRLTNMVEELLDFSRLTSGNMKLKKRFESIEDNVNYIKNYLTPRAKRENVDFQVFCQPNIPEVYMDPDRIKQILLNLVDNAIKFNKSGGFVFLNVITDSSNLVMTVEDNGCGISKEELPRVKEKFYKGKNSKSQNGIGLSICDEIIKLHNGTFDIESELGKGTKITVKIPMITDGNEVVDEQD